MRPVFAVFLAVVILDTAVFADEEILSSVRYSDIPMSEAVADYGTPAVTEYRIIPPPAAERSVEPYTVSKPPLVTLPEITPETPSVPVLPKKNPPLPPETIRAQSPPVNELEEILKTPLPHAKGVIEAGMIEPKLVENPVLAESNGDFFTSSSVPNNVPAPLPPAQTAAETKPDPLMHGVLLVSTVITTIALIYMVFVAYDYRQRWVQSLTAQNDRYLGGAFDAEFGERYGGGTLPHTDNYLGLSH
ncbi:MAG: hypothetical protein LBH00_10205 [Planctomycetaceae bacterium]|nr:hypothetical protein [Planctomycetaceae bacterium]